MVEFCVKESSRSAPSGTRRHPSLGTRRHPSAPVVTRRSVREARGKFCMTSDSLPPYPPLRGSGSPTPPTPLPPPCRSQQLGLVLSRQLWYTWKSLAGWHAFTGSCWQRRRIWPAFSAFSTDNLDCSFSVSSQSANVSWLGTLSRSS